LEYAKRQSCQHDAGDSGGRCSGFEKDVICWHRKSFGLLRRTILGMIVSALEGRFAAAAASPEPRPSRRKVVLVTIGGVRRKETFSEAGLHNIPRLAGEMVGQSIFYPRIWNEGVTSHFNTITSILTGVWQHVDDWGRDRPADPTLLQYLQSQWSVGPSQTWVVTSNKALTANVGVGANVILSKQLLVESVERIIMGTSRHHQLQRDMLLEELTAVMQDDYERIGWSVPSSSAVMDPAVKNMFLTALAAFINGPDSPTSGDELTWFVATEVLKRVSPAILVVNLSDVEVAHSGTYSLHLAGIRRTDALIYRLWNVLQSLPEYRDNVTMVIVPEFGRDPDGSSTNGFFNHRTDTSTNRMVWAMILGAAVRKPAVVEREVRQIDLAPSLGALLGVECTRAAGRVLTEFAG